MDSKLIHAALEEYPLKYIKSDLFNTSRWVTREEAHFLYNLARFHKIQAVVESGTANGYSTTWFAAAVIENGGGSVHTWDPQTRPKVWALDEMRDLLPLIHYHPQAFDPSTLDRARPPALWFIDGDHSPKGAEADLKLFFAHKQPFDVLVLHDIDGYKHLKRFFWREATQARDYVYVPSRRGVGAIFF